MFNKLSTPINLLVHPLQCNMNLETNIIFLISDRVLVLFCIWVRINELQGGPSLCLCLSYFYKGPEFEHKKISGSLNLTFVCVCVCLEWAAHSWLNMKSFMLDWKSTLWEVTYMSLNCSSSDFTGTARNGWKEGKIHEPVPELFKLRFGQVR